MLFLDASNHHAHVLSFHDDGNSEWVCTEGLCITEVFGGLDGSITATYVVDTVTDREGIKDTLRVRVQDLDAGGGGADSVLVTVVNGSVPPDTEWVWLPQIAPLDSFIYEGRVPTDEGVAAIVGNGVLELDTQGTTLDTLWVQYLDLLTAMKNGLR